MKKLTQQEFCHRAKNIIAIDQDVEGYNIYMVWFNYTLGHMKGLFSYPGSGAPYIEVTYNSEKGEMYLDYYKKEKQILVENNGGQTN